MIARRIRTLILRSTSRFPLRNLTAFHSSAVSNRRFSNSFVDDEEGSAIYRLALKFQRPTTVKVQPRLRNHVSFIGTVGRPLKVIKTTEAHNFGVHTLLNVKNPQNSDRTFRSVYFFLPFSSLCLYIEMLMLGIMIFGTGYY